MASTGTDAYYLSVIREGLQRGEAGIFCGRVSFGSRIKFTERTNDNEQEDASTVLYDTRVPQQLIKHARQEFAHEIASKKSIHPTPSQNEQETVREEILEPETPTQETLDSMDVSAIAETVVTELPIADEEAEASTIDEPAATRTISKESAIKEAQLEHNKEITNSNNLLDESQEAKILYWSTKEHNVVFSVGSVGIGKLIRRDQAPNFEANQAWIEQHTRVRVFNITSDPAFEASPSHLNFLADYVGIDNFDHITDIKTQFARVEWSRFGFQGNSLRNVQQDLTPPSGVAFLKWLAWLSLNNPNERGRVVVALRNRDLAPIPLMAEVYSNLLTNWVLEGQHKSLDEFHSYVLHTVIRRCSRGTPGCRLA